mgnify:CR=1 FL=1
MIKINLQNNNSVCLLSQIGSKRGFVLLFAVTFSSIILAIALGVTNIAFKEIKFGTNARDTNDAFFAADTGIESVFFLDKDPANFPMPSEGNMERFDIPPIVGLGSNNVSCAIVTITKDNTDSSNPTTTIISKGYHIGDGSCNSTNPDRIEREIKVSY